MTDAPLDLDPIRARLSGMWAGGYPIATGWPAKAAVDIKALLAEVERWRRVGQCFHRPPALLGAPLTCTLAAGHAGAHSDGSAHWAPIVDLDTEEHRD